MTFEPERQKATGGWKKLYRREHHSKFSSLYTIRVMP